MRAQVAELRARGVDAFLVGEAFMRDPDPGAALRAPVLRLVERYSARTVAKLRRAPIEQIEKRRIPRRRRERQPHQETEHQRQHRNERESDDSETVNRQRADVPEFALKLSASACIGV